MRCPLLVLPMLLTVASCASPPKPPTVDETNKRPANAAVAVELQVCKGELDNTRIVADESGRRAESNGEALRQLVTRQQVLVAMSMKQTANSLYVVNFDFASARVVVPASIFSALIADVRAAPLVLIRGRTDGSTDSPAESRVARERAAAMRDYLIGAGADPARIRATYQPVGDYATDNASQAGKDMNRRVEIEVYRSLPVAMGIAALAVQ